MSGYSTGCQRSGEMHFCFYLIIKRVITSRVINLPIDTLRPIVRCHLGIAFYHVAIYIERTPFVHHREPYIRCSIFLMTIIISADSNSGNPITDIIVRSCRSRLIIVVHYVHVHTFTAITTVATPIVEHIVTHIHIFVLLCFRTRAKTGHTASVMCQ